MKRDLTILGLAAIAAAVGVLLLMRSGDDEPSPVAKVEQAAQEFPNVRAARCREVADRRFRCRVVRTDRTTSTCRAGTDASGRLSNFSCAPVKGR